MTDYKIYRLDAAQRIVSPALIMQRETDDAVIEAIKRQMAGQSVEIWDGQRCVGTVLAVNKQ
jgi:hypothetical protein